MSQVGGYSAIALANGGKKASTHTATPGQPVAQTPNESASKTVGTPYDAGEFGSASKTASSRMKAIRANAGKNSGLSVLQFPKNLGLDEQPHYMMFTTHAIKGTVGASGSDTSFGGAEGFVVIPIPANPTAAYEQGWDTEEAGIALSSLVTGTQDVMEEYNDAGGGLAGMVGAGKAIGSKILETGKTVADAGVVGNIGRLVGSRALSQSTGQAIFDQSFAVYGGPAYRSFSYQYSLMPLSRGDVDQIKMIVDFFKINSAPVSKGAGTVARIYGLPKAFQIKYYNKGRENQYMNKIGKCALTSINVTYGGERFTTFDGMDAPVQVNLNLSFKELQLQDSASMAEGY